MTPKQVTTGARTRGANLHNSTPAVLREKDITESERNAYMRGLFSQSLPIGASHASPEDDRRSIAPEQDDSAMVSAVYPKSGAKDQVSPFMSEPLAWKKARHAQTPSKSIRKRHQSGC